MSPSQNRKAAGVLVIDDHEDARNMVATLLTLEGYTVVTACDGSEGLACLRQWRPCLILLDLMMPGMDGFEFRQRQTQDPEIADIPVLLVTAAPEARAHATRMSAVGVLRKPIEMSALLETVRKYCGEATRA